MSQDLITLVADINRRRPAVRRFNNYYRGVQPVQFVGEKLQSEFGKQLESLSCNRCGPVVDAIADRLQVDGFSDRGEQDLGEAATAYWSDSGTDLLSGEVHTEALIAGDSFVIVWPDADNNMVIYPQPSESMAVLYDPERPGTIAVAAKGWQRRDGTWRVNLYYADRLEKYASRTKGNQLPDRLTQWEQHRDHGDPEWPIRLNFKRVPVFHFATNARTGQYGVSELEAIVPLQDRLNQTIANLAIAEEFQSFRQRWATGIQPVLDEDTGEPVSPFKAGVDRLWIATEEGVKFGEFGAADLTQFEQVLEGHEVRIARTARVPLHYLVQSGTPPSGEALKTAEAPFVAKITDRQKAFGAVWAQIMNFIYEQTQDVETRFKTRWQAAEPRSDKDFWDHSLTKRELGVSPKQILNEAGYSDEEIERFADEVREFDASAGDAVVRAFNAA